MFKTEFEFVLNDKIEYAVGGDTKTASNITVKAPSYNDTKYVLKLHALVNQATTSYLSSIKELLAKRITSTDTPENKEPTHEDQVNDIVTILVSGNYDTDKLLDIFNELILKSGKLDGKELLTPFLLGKLSPRETLRLIGEYIANFPLAV